MSTWVGPWWGHVVWDLGGCHVLHVVWALGAPGELRLPTAPAAGLASQPWAGDMGSSPHPHDRRVLCSPPP